MIGKQVLAFGKSEKLEFIYIGSFGLSGVTRIWGPNTGRSRRNRVRSHVWVTDIALLGKQASEKIENSEHFEVSNQIFSLSFHLKSVHCDNRNHAIFWCTLNIPPSLCYSPCYSTWRNHALPAAKMYNI